MALRLIEMVLREEDGEELGELLKKHKVLEHRQIRLLDGEVMVRILLDVEQSEAVPDLLEKRYTSAKGNRLVILPVAATSPRADPAPIEQPPALKKSPERISREELYEDIKNGARCSHVYMAMAVLSTFVAAIGLYYNSVDWPISRRVSAPMGSVLDRISANSCSEIAGSNRDSTPCLLVRV